MSKKFETLREFAEGVLKAAATMGREDHVIVAFSVDEDGNLSIETQEPPTGVPAFLNVPITPREGANVAEPTRS